MRVLHVTESASPEAGSAAIPIRGLHQALQRLGIASGVCAPGSNAPGGKETNAGAFSANPDATPDSERRELMGRVDLVHFHGWGTSLHRRLARTALSANKPYVISPYGAMSDGPHNRATLWKRLRRLLQDRRLVRRAAAVAAVNDMEEAALRQAGIHSTIVTLPCGLDFAEYAEAKLSEAHRSTHAAVGKSARTGGPIGKQSRMGIPEVRGSHLVKSRGAGGSDVRWLLMLGPIHPVFGFVPLLKGLAELGSQSDGWNVALVGREAGRWRAMLEAAIRRKEAADRVIFDTAADLDSQRAWLKRASALVSPSLHVHCPVSLLQGAASGLAILGTTCVVPSPLEPATIVCRPLRHEIKLSLRKLLGMSDDERSAMGQQAREAARRSFDWPVLVNQYVQLYERFAR